MFRKALTLHEELDEKNGVAVLHCNLGVVFQARGDIAAACRSWSKSRDMFAEIGAGGMVEKISDLMKNSGCPQD